MTEEIRLIVWDLDETFWHGTLTEGGIRIRPDTCALVKDLAARGIMSSICSKNNLADVRAVLEREGVWSFFIFPSVDWESKGPRVAALVEAVQLRAPTVMFIDDNPMNLAEVAEAVPGIQVRSHDFIREIAASPLFVGKDDAGLSRLTQYKLLETRKRDEQATPGDNTEFLRRSGIRVELERDVETHIDRVVELINRTNQLNFTKIRLPEDPVEARAHALDMLRQYNVQAGLVRVSDCYGDHGFTGIYVMNAEHNRLVHFCFSCRILGMGVEQWLYNLLKRPHLAIKGEVLSDPKDTSRPVDWINQAGVAAMKVARLSVDTVVAHGGCDLSAIAHYLSVHDVEVVPEFNIMRHGFSLRVDHSVFLQHAKHGLTEAQSAVARQLRYEDVDFTSALFERHSSPRAVLLSFASDAHYALYRHRETGLLVPCLLGLGPVSRDQRLLDLPADAQTGPRADTLRLLKAEFDFHGITAENDFRHVARLAFESAGPHDRVFVLRPCEYHLNKTNGDHYPVQSFIDVNRWTEEVAGNFPNVTLLDLPDFVQDPGEIDNILHYDRKVYFRVYERIAQMLQDDTNLGHKTGREMVDNA